MKKIYFALAAVAAVFAGCSNEVEPEQPTPVIVIEKNVSLSASVGDPLTKVSSDNAGIFKWQLTDKITAVTDGNAIRQFEVGNIGVAGTSAEFNGSIPDESTITYALYPASESHKASDNNITFHLDENVTWNADASGMPMIATVVGDEASFKSVGGVLKLILFNIPSEAGYLKFSASKQITGDFNIADASVKAPVIATSTSDGNNELIIDFSANYSASKVFYIPLPTGTIDGFTVSLYESLSDADPLFSVTSPKSIVMAANKLIIAPAIDASARYLWSENFSSFAANDVPSGGKYLYSCTGSGTKIYNDTFAGGSTPELLVAKNNGTFTAGSITTNGASSITLKYKTNAKALSVSSTTEGVNISPNNSSEAGEHIATVTNTNGANSISLTFTATSSDNARLDDIKLIIPGQGYTAPSITATDEALTIGVGESSATTTVSLANAVDNLGISAILSGDNADKFTATIDGTTLTVTASEINSTDAAYTATVTLKASGATAQSIAITQTSSLVPNPTDLTATPGDASATITWTKGAHATSYVAYLHTDETATPATGGTTVTESISEGWNSMSLIGLTNNTTYHLYIKVNGVDDNYSAASDFAHVSFKPVAAKVLENIALTTSPTTTTYNVGAPFSLAGAVVTATYNDETTADVTESCTTTYDFSTAGNKTVIISYTEGSITKTCECNVTVAIVDVLTNATTGISGTTYSTWSGKSKQTSGSGITSDAVYSGQSAGGNSSIQLRSDNNNSGIITTTSGGLVKKISVAWNSNTSNGRTLSIYGKNSAYSAVTDLYNNSNQGTLLGTIVKGTSTELIVTGDYEFVGLRSASGAMYIDAIDIQWEPAPTKYDITIADGISNGSVSASVSKAKEGESVTLTATPEPGYAFDAWDVYKSSDSNIKIFVTNNAFTMPAYDVEVSATFVAVPTISVETTSISDVDAAGVTNVDIENAYSLLNGATRSKVKVTCDETIVTAASTPADRTIRYSVSENSGAARTDGWIKVQYDEEETIYEISVSQLAATYTVEVGDHANGTVSINPTSPVAVNAEVTLTATADTGYEFKSWDVHKKDDSSTIVTVTNNKFTMPAYAVTINATFDKAGGGSSQETVTFSAQGYSNQQEITSYTGTDFTVAFDKGTNSNAPKYFTLGEAIRAYGGNYFTVSSSKTIIGIVLAFGSSDGSNAITANVGTYSSGTWSGSDSSVTFTIGGTSGNRRLASITVTFAGSGSSTTVATPTFSVAEGTYNTAQTVTINCSTDGATIYYTTDGTPPTNSSDQYTSAVTVDKSKTLKAIAIKGSDESAVASATYTLKVATPSISPNGGSFDAAQNVTITCTTGDATIHYTIDKSTPSEQSSTYSGAISISETKTIKAIAVKTGWDNSEVASADFTIGGGGGDVDPEPETANYSFAFSTIGSTGWSNSYENHSVSETECTVTFNASKQTGTITDYPVTKGQPVILVLKSAVATSMKRARFVCQQWSSKTQTITLHYSTDGGNTWTSTGVTSSNFTIEKDNLPSGTNAVKITFNTTSNQVGIQSADIDYYPAD